MGRNGNIEPLHELGSTVRHVSAPLSSVQGGLNDVVHHGPSRVQRGILEDEAETTGTQCRARGIAEVVDRMTVQHDCPRVEPKHEAEQV